MSAIALGRIDLIDDELPVLERPDTPRYEFPGVSDDTELARIAARLGFRPAAS